MKAGILVTILAATTSAWGQAPGVVQKLFSSSGQSFETFGSAVDMEGGRSVVGGRLLNRVWIYELGPDLWEESASFQGPDTVFGDCFGGAVCLSGETLLIGAQRDSNENGAQAGSAYVFTKSGSVWTFQSKLLPSTGLPGDETGHDVALEGDTAVLGSFGSPNAYVYERTGTTWDEVQVISVTDGGWALSVALQSSAMVIGSPNAMPRGILSTGAVYTYVPDGRTWSQEQTLLPSVVDDFGEFGLVVRISGDSIVATARNEDVTGSHRGAAYVFHKTGPSWQQEAHLISPQGEADDNFGWFADIEGDRVVVSEHTNQPGQDANSSYLFERSGTTWGAGLNLMPAPIGCDMIACRNPPALAEPYLVVGADADDGAVPDSGSAYVYLFPEDPVTYCTGKTNSQGCVPQMTWSGQPTFTGPDDFVVSATDVLPGKNGVFFFGVNGAAVLPFIGGTLCALPPLKRGIPQQATPGSGCAGTIAHLFGQADMMTAGLDPGELAHGQFWLRDPDHPDGTGAGLSNGIEVQINP